MGKVGTSRMNHEYTITIHLDAQGGSVVVRCETLDVEHRASFLPDEDALAWINDIIQELERLPKGDKKG